MWPARAEIGTKLAHRRPHMCDCDGARIMHTKLSQPQNCHKPRRKRSKRTQSVQVIQPSPVAQQGCAPGPGLNLPPHGVTSCHMVSAPVCRLGLRHLFLVASLHPVKEGWSCRQHSATMMNNELCPIGYWSNRVLSSDQRKFRGRNFRVTDF